METYYTIYKITNIINGMIYIGKHQTKDVNDGYMGSGKHLAFCCENPAQSQGCGLRGQQPNNLLVHTKVLF